MIISGCREFRTGERIIVLAAELLTTLPAPRLSTACANREFVVSLKTACKNVVAGGVFQTPSLAPGTLFSVLHACHACYLPILVNLDYVLDENTFESHLERIQM